jgi:hypothetical protein
MNKRIKELKIQACKWASENAPFAEYENAADQKFAELIVAECGVALNPPVQVRNVISRGQAYNLIKQHFGVE